MQAAVVNQTRFGGELFFAKLAGVFVMNAQRPVILLLVAFLKAFATITAGVVHPRCVLYSVGVPPVLL